MSISSFDKPNWHEVGEKTFFAGLSVEMWGKSVFFGARGQLSYPCDVTRTLRK